MSKVQIRVTCQLLEKPLFDHWAIIPLAELDEDLMILDSSGIDFLLQQYIGIDDDALFQDEFVDPTGLLAVQYLADRKDIRHSLRVNKCDVTFTITKAMNGSH